jgi:Response regulators consisting of a CheY-like receiver domain and a winged-helix DNA-binding domain
VRETVLIVEDEKDIVKMLEYNLKKESFKTLFARNGEDALDLAKSRHPDLIILDLMLPCMDGLEVCKAIRGDSKTASIPIVMLTAKSQESDKIVGLELGADDYMTKPFSPRELIARVKAILRRGSGKGSASEILSSGDLVVDLAKISVTIKGKPVGLASKEFELLKELMKSKGRVLSRDHLLDTVWGFDHAIEIQTRTVDVHIRTLRKKLKGESHRIVTVKNYGYRFDDAD